MSVLLLLGMLATASSAQTLDHGSAWGPCDSTLRTSAADPTNPTPGSTITFGQPWSWAHPCTFEAQLFDAAGERVPTVLRRPAKGAIEMVPLQPLRAGRRYHVVIWWAHAAADAPTTIAFTAPREAHPRVPPPPTIEEVRRVLAPTSQRFGHGPPPWEWMGLWLGNARETTVWGVWLLDGEGSDPYLPPPYMVFVGKEGRIEPPEGVTGNWLSAPPVGRVERLGLRFLGQDGWGPPTEIPYPPPATPPPSDR